MRRSPVHLAHPAGHLADLDRISDLERPLHQEHQPGEEVAQRLLQREAEDDGAHAQRRERALELPTPDELVDQRGGERDQQETEEVPEEPGDPALPAPCRGVLEDRQVDEPEHEDHADHPAGGLDQPHPQAVSRQPEQGTEQEQDGEQRQEPVPHPPDAGGQGLCRRSSESDSSVSTSSATGNPSPSARAHTPRPFRSSWSSLTPRPPPAPGRARPCPSPGRRGW